MIDINHHVPEEAVDLEDIQPQIRLTPFPNLDSLLVTAIVLSYYGCYSECKMLMYTLSKQSLKYAREKNDKLDAFIVRDKGRKRVLDWAI